MHYVVAVSVIKRITDLHAEPEGLVNGNWHVHVLEPRLQRFPCEVFHHQVHRIVLAPDIVQDANIRVIEGGDRSCLPFEARSRIRSIR